jgi:DNA polymerase-1
VFLSFDYTNAEFIGLAYETRDPKLIEVVEKGLNIHDINTRMLFKITKEHPEWKVYRQVSKIYQFAKIQYGGSRREIFNKILVEIPHLKMTFKEFCEIDIAYFLEHPQQCRWNDLQQEQAMNTRMVRTALGFTRILYGPANDIKKQAINTPIQGLIAQIINQAVIRICKVLRLGEYDCRLVLQIHDQLVFECAETENTNRVVEVIKTEMEHPIKIHDVDVVFPVDVSTGYNLAEMEDYKAKRVL